MSIATVFTLALILIFVGFFLLLGSMAIRQIRINRNRKAQNDAPSNQTP